MADLRSNLNALPIELLCLITGCLPKKDLKNLRTMNKKLCVASSYNLFQTITLSTSHESITQLAHVASSEPWSLQVRHVDWSLPIARALFYSSRPTLKIMFVEFEETDLAKELSRGLEFTSCLRQGKQRRTYSVLAFHCHLLRRMPNIRSIRFLKGRKSKMSDMEPKQGHSSIVAAMRYSELDTSLDGGAEFTDKTLPSHNWTTGNLRWFCFSLNQGSVDILALLKYAKARPTRVVTACTRFSLTYGIAGMVENIHLVNRSRPSLREPRKERSILRRDPDEM